MLRLAKVKPSHQIHRKRQISYQSYFLCFYSFNNVVYFLLIGRFVQSWSVRNNGEEAWPYGCYIKCSSNENLPVVPVNPIEPGQCTVISVSLTSPSELGSYQTKWRLFTSNGSCFGGTITSIVFLYQSGCFVHILSAGFTGEIVDFLATYFKSNSSENNRMNFTPYLQIQCGQ